MDLSFQNLDGDPEVYGDLLEDKWVVDDSMMAIYSKNPWVLVHEVTIFILLRKCLNIHLWHIVYFILWAYKGQGWPFHSLSL